MLFRSSRIAIDDGDDVLTKGNDGEWRGGPYDAGDRVWVGLPDDPESYLPVTLLYRPDAPVAAGATVTREQVSRAIEAHGPVGRAWYRHGQQAVPLGWVTDFLTALGLTVADGPTEGVDRG